jgi:hypothetical protein
MGYTTILDIIGSVIMGGVLMITLLNTHANAVQNTYNYGGDVNVQQGLALLVNTIDSDFRKIGYSSIQTFVLNPTQVIILADTSKIKFLSDINNNGTIDTVYYYLTTTSGQSNSILYRMTHDNVSAAVTSQYPGVSIFRFAYYDSSSNQLSCPVSSPSKIAKINISLQMQSAQPYNGVYVSTYWNSTKRIAINVMNR